MGELVIGDSVSAKAKLWRYMSLDKLIDLLATRKLYLSPLRSLRERDPFEGYMPRVAIGALASVFSKQLRELEEARNKLPASASKPKLAALDEKIDQIRVDVPKIMESVAEATVVNCWHESESESEAMWRLYSDSGKGIAIVTHVESLQCALLPLPEEHSLYLSAIKYLDFDSTQLQPNDCVVDGHVAPLIKRKSYQHEREVRLFTTPLTGSEDMLRVTPAAVLIPVNIHALIEEVWISPFASEPFISSTRVIARAFEIDQAIVRQSPLLDRSRYLIDSLGPLR